MSFELQEQYLAFSGVEARPLRALCLTKICDFERLTERSYSTFLTTIPPRKSRHYLHSQAVRESAEPLVVAYRTVRPHRPSTGNRFRNRRPAAQNDVCSHKRLRPLDHGHMRRENCNIRGTMTASRVRKDVHEELCPIAAGGLAHRLVYSTTSRASRIES